MLYVICQYNRLLSSDVLVCGRYPEAVSCFTLNSPSRCFINLLIKFPPLSVRMYLGAPYWEKRVVATAQATVVVFRSGIGTAMQYLLKLSCIVRMCLFPFGVVGNLGIGSRVRARTSFCSRQLLHPRMNSLISSRKLGHVYRSLI